MADTSIDIRQGSTEDEFWKRYDGLRDMLLHMKKRVDLIRGIRAEAVIPDQARDMAITALTTELQGNKQVFFDYLLNFISVGMQVLHRVDLEVQFTIPEGTKAEMNSCTLIVDDTSQPLPVEIGTRFIAFILDRGGQKHLDTILTFYREEETRYDKLFGGSLDRCYLKVTEELYPRRCVHVTLRVPAQSLIEYRISLQ